MKTVQADRIYFNTFFEQVVYLFFLALSRDLAQRLEATSKVHLGARHFWEIIYYYPGTIRSENYHWQKYVINRQSLITTAQRYLESIKDNGINFQDLYRFPADCHYKVMMAMLILNVLEENNSNYHAIFNLKEPEPGVFLSPAKGTFFRAPNPQDPPFVNVDDIVEKGQPIGVLMVSKTVNYLTAEEPGKIIEICIGNNTEVEADQKLFIISPIE